MFSISYWFKTLHVEVSSEIVFATVMNLHSVFNLLERHWRRKQSFWLSMWLNLPPPVFFWPGPYSPKGSIAESLGSVVLSWYAVQKPLIFYFQLISLEVSFSHTNWHSTRKQIIPKHKFSARLAYSGRGRRKSREEEAGEKLSAYFY